MAVSTASTTLKYYVTSSYTKLCDITSYPDMGSAPSKLDTTDLSAVKMKTSINGLQEAPDLTFEANYDETAYTLISGLTGTQKFELELGLNGADGKFAWEGDISIMLNGGGVDEVRKMTISCSASTEITYTAGA
jgi:hypothetical protein